VGESVGLGKGMAVGRGRVGLSGTADGIGGKGLGSVALKGGISALAGTAPELHPARAINNATGSTTRK